MLLRWEMSTRVRDAVHVVRSGASNTIHLLGQLHVPLILIRFSPNVSLFFSLLILLSFEMQPRIKYTRKQ